VVAKSSLVASTFFAPTGLLAAIGFGVAVTPIGWVVAAGVVSGGAWFGITRHLKKTAASKVTVVPNFINTPLDVLALGLFDLMVPLALRVAAADGRIDVARRHHIVEYFVGEWGYDANFVAAGIRHLEASLGELSVRDLAQTMAEFANQNRDCNFKLMSQEILDFLRHIVASDGASDPHEEQAILEIESIFKAASRFSVRRKLRAAWAVLRGRSGRLVSRRKT
jgi:tellurite resistance protein